MSKRILDETTKSTFASDDYLYMDNATDGAAKITPDNLVRNTTVAQQLAQHIADAEDEVEQITGDITTIQGDITDVKSDLGDLADLETEDKSSLVNAINEAKSSGGSSVPTSVRSAILTLFESAAYAETGLTDEIAVIESWAETVTEITLSAQTLSISGATTQTLTATTVPSSATVTWSTSDATIATVSGGVVTGVSNGTCTITASAGDLSARCAVTVSGFATLTSISAVYTQSGTVYDTDSLDDLKADLVVTANYDNSTTATVASTDYTLSGTLAEGTSTITVSYGGKTATFNVTVIEEPTYLFDAAGRSWTAIYSDDGSTTQSLATDGTKIVDYEFATDTTVTFHVELTSSAYRQLYIVSADTTNSTIGNNGEYVGMTGYRATNMKSFYTEGNGNNYALEGNIYDGTYTVKAGCKFAITNCANTFSESSQIYL